MKNYLPLTEPGTSRMRVNRAQLQNQYGSSPAVLWYEEEQILMADGSFKYMPRDTMYQPVTPELLASTITIRDPDTNAAIGTITGAMLLAAVQSLYLDCAEARDAAEAAVANPPPSTEP